MPAADVRKAEYRKRRVKWLKKGIVLMRLLFLLIPAALCVFLFCRLESLSKTLEELSVRVETVAAENALLETQVQALMQKSSEPEEETRRETGPEESARFAAASAGEGAVAAGGGADQENAERNAAHKVYLTFDDGPSSNTEKILDILDEYNVKATFFVVGKEGDWAQDALRDIVARGHTLGMHSYSHRYADLYSSVESFAEDFVKLRGYLEEVTGVVSSVYRFPGGSSNTVSDIDMHEFAEYLLSWDVRFFDWNASSGDGGRKLLTVDELVGNSLDGIEKRETTVLLLHDAAGKPTTVEALPEIIESILAMEDTVILPITEDTTPVQHIHLDEKNGMEVE